jgi:hypothetical protein
MHLGFAKRVACESVARILHHDSLITDKILAARNHQQAGSPGTAGSFPVFMNAQLQPNAKNNGIGQAFIVVSDPESFPHKHPNQA